MIDKEMCHSRWLEETKKYAWTNSRGERCRGLFVQPIFEENDRSLSEAIDYGGAGVRYEVVGSINLPDGSASIANRMARHALSHHLDEFSVEDYTSMPPNTFCLGDLLRASFPVCNGIIKANIGGYCTIEDGLRELDEDLRKTYREHKIFAGIGVTLMEYVMVILDEMLSDESAIDEVRKREMILCIV